MMKMIIRALLLVLFFIVAHCGLIAATECNISGIVKQAGSEELIIGATVAIYDFANGTAPENAINGAFSNKFGFYSISGLKPGKYLLKVSYIGHKSLLDTLEVNKENTRLNYSLEQEDVKLKKIVVSSDRTRETIHNISTVKIDPKMSLKLPAIGGEPDIFRTLQLLPGVQRSSEISSGLSVRGGDPNQNLVLLDGINVYNPMHIGNFLSTFNPDPVKTFKLIKGAFPAEYGGRLSSVIDINLKDGTKEGLHGAGGISLISSRLTLEGPVPFTDKKSTFMISGRRTYFDVLMNLMVPEDELEDMGDYYFYDLYSKINFEFNENDRIYVSGLFTRDVINGPEDNSEHFKMYWGNKTGSIRWTHIMDDNMFTHLTVYHTNFNFTTELWNKSSDSKDQLKTESDISDWGMKAEWQYRPVRDHFIKSGIDVMQHHFFSQLSTEFADFDELDIKPRDIKAAETALFMQDEWAITDELLTNIGGRLYYFQAADYWDFEPRISLAYDLTEKIVLKTSYSTMNQCVHRMIYNDIALPTDLWMPSDDDMMPSKSWQIVLGAETTIFEDNYLVSLEGFYKDMKNLYDYSDTSMYSFGLDLNQHFVQGVGSSRGIELFIQKRYGDLLGWIAYTLSWADRRFDELNNGNKFSPRYDRRHDFKIVLTYMLGRDWEIGANWEYTTGQAFTMPTSMYIYRDPIHGYTWEKFHFSDRNGERLPDYHRLDLNIMMHFEMFSTPATFYISLYNVYNQKNAFAWYIADDWEQDRKVLKQITILPFVPTIGLNFRF